MRSRAEEQQQQAPALSCITPCWTRHQHAGAQKASLDLGSEPSPDCASLSVITDTEFITQKLLGKLRGFSQHRLIGFSLVTALLSAKSRLSCLIKNTNTLGA